MSADSALNGRIDGIVIGASAGGVEALCVLLPALPADLRAAVFVVLHLPRGRPSLLVEIFERKCALLVCEAEDKAAVRPGTVYFAPSDYHLLLNPGPVLALCVDEPVHHSRPSIDVLFESAADVFGQRLLGIMLTGANADGARGLATVHERGGVTIVQEPATAYAPFMVRSALRLHRPDHVLPLSGIADLLRTLGATPSRGI